MGVQKNPPRDARTLAASSLLSLVRTLGTDIDVPGSLFVVATFQFCLSEGRSGDRSQYVLAFRIIVPDHALLADFQHDCSGNASRVHAVLVCWPQQDYAVKPSDDCGVYLRALACVAKQER